MALISSFGEVNLDALDATITDNAVDIFVYDTRKDSDGGKWRKRTKKTSWYNEELNTATRGSRREFPAVAVIVCINSGDNGYLKIYDGDDPDLPLWMEIRGTTLNRNSGWMYLTPIRGVYALNGIIALATYGNGVDSGGTHIVDFAKDELRRHSSAGGRSGGGLLITQNGTSVNLDTSISLNLVVSDLQNDIAMTVLPNAPIDSATGLPIPTIAVATDGGVSVIKDDGSVVDLTYVEGSNGISNMIDIDSTGRIYWSSRETGDAAGVYFFEDNIPSADKSSQPPVNLSVYQAGVTNSLKYLISGKINKIIHGNNFTCIGINGYDLKPHIELYSTTGDVNASAGLDNIKVADITTDYNTGWMHGDIKGAFLADISVGSLTANTNLATGFTLSLSNRLQSHTYDNGDISWQMVDNTGNVAGFVELSMPNLTAGKSYIVSMTVDNHAAFADGSPYITRITHTSDGTNTFFNHWDVTSASPITLSASFVSKSSTGQDLLTIYASDITMNVTNLSVREVEDQDRSVNNKGLQVFGTVTKSPVATGAELVAYSGFSASNYLQQPYNSDLDFGTGDFSVMGWLKCPVDGTGLFLEKSPNGGGNGFYWYVGSTGVISARMGYNGTVIERGTINVVDINSWIHFSVVRRNGTIYRYINGALDSSFNLPYSFDTTEPLKLGKGNDVIMALWRISKTAPSAEQIKKIYEDEKVLFQENAKCTLYGTSQGVTALAYDDKTNLLHVGTSSGRSDFKGLRRINNTTTGITTAISASNRLIAEQ